MNFEAFNEVATYEIIAIGGTPVTPARLATFAAIVLLSAFISRWTRALVRRAWKRRGVEDDGALAVGLRLFHYTVLLLGMGIGLQVIGIRLSALFAAGAVLAVGIGFATQTLVQNFVSGVILLVERSIKPGDVLEFHGEVVRVTEMGIRRTIVRTVYDEDVIVPNSDLVQMAVKNLTYSDRLYRLHVGVGVSYGSNLDEVMSALLEAAIAVEERAELPEPRVLLTGFGNSTVDFDVSVWITSPWRLYRVRSDLLMSIWRSLHAAGIEIAFPQLDVHFDDDVTGALRSFGGKAA